MKGKNMRTIAICAAIVLLWPALYPIRYVTAQALHTTADLLTR